MTDTDRNLFIASGYCYFTEDKGLLSASSWEAIEKTVFSPELPWEHVLIGDAGEPNRVDVGRFMTDVDFPRVVNPTLSYPLLAHLYAEPIVALARRLIDRPDLYIRRCQVNRMHTGSFVGPHIDTDSNPDYQISVVLQLGSGFGGGAMRFHGECPKVVTPAYRSVLVTDSRIPHEVEPVTNGQRTSLVYFLAEGNGANRRQQAGA